MTCFADNDILLKVAACDLLEEMLSVLNVPRSRVRVLPTARGYFQRNSRLRRSHTEEQIRRAIDFVDSASTSDRRVDPEEYRLLSGVDGIDSGAAGSARPAGATEREERAPMVYSSTIHLRA